MQIHTKSGSKVTGARPGLAFHLFVFLHVPDLNLTLKITKSCQNQDVTLRTEEQKEKVRIGIHLSSHWSGLCWPWWEVCSIVLTCSRLSFLVQFQSQILDHIWGCRQWLWPAWSRTPHRTLRSLGSRPHRRSDHSWLFPKLTHSLTPVCTSPYKYSFSN